MFPVGNFLFIAATLIANAAPTFGVPTTHTVEIFVTNDCFLTVNPNPVTISASDGGRVLFKNRSADYSVDVWASRGYGFLDLETWTEWQDDVAYCANQFGGGSFDITISGLPMRDPYCPGQTLSIACR